MIDFLLNEELDLQIVDGAFVIGEVTEQNQQLLLLTKKGDWREHPTQGVGLYGFLKDDDRKGLLAEIKKEFDRDGMQVKGISIEGENITVNAAYK